MIKRDYLGRKKDQRDWLSANWPEFDSFDWLGKLPFSSRLELYPQQGTVRRFRLEAYLPVVGAGYEDSSYGSTTSGCDRYLYRFDAGIRCQVYVCVNNEAPYVEAHLRPIC